MRSFFKALFIAVIVFFVIFFFFPDFAQASFGTSFKKSSGDLKKSSGTSSKKLQDIEDMQTIKKLLFNSANEE